MSELIAFLNVFLLNCAACAKTAQFMKETLKS